MRKFKKENPTKFDREGFFLGIGIGGVSLAFGTFLGWAVLTAPAGGPSASYALSLGQRVARLIPHSIQTWIALGLAGLFVLFGVFVLGMGLWTVASYLFAKIR